MSFLINKGCGVNIRFSDKESDAVKIAADNLGKDLSKVIDAVSGFDAEIVIGTAGVSDIISGYVSSDELKDNDKLHKETYLHKIADNKLIIAGADRRGTIYGIYEFSEMIGVSPWYYFADVPVKRKDKIELDDSYFKRDYPAVEYRGIFINDEEELDNWVRLNLGEETIGVKAYEKIFELLLRLKANYIWPAMHVNSFNIKRENGMLADRMGIVVGTSHCDMLMRSNNREWKPWLEAKGYEGAEYDYSEEGRNREILKEYWRESIEQNKDFEVSYTLGMRGVHDSGFEVSAFKGVEGDELLKAKINLLETVISDQEQMLGEILNKDTMKTFVPYKEVLNLYDAGLKVPEDLTLIWSNDNYGYIRRYPSEKDRKRRGGNGIYYHNSYWAPPNASYLFICSIPLAHTKNELSKAYNEGVQKLWVLNVGAIKPIEPEMEFFLRYAWEITKEASTADVDLYMEQWINKNFSGNHGRECALIFNEFDSIVNMRKIEHMENDVFSLSAYGDEWTVRVNRLKGLYDRANTIYSCLKDDEKDAFYQLVLMKIHAGYFMNMQYYYADRSKYCHEKGMLSAAARYTEYSIRMDDEKRKLVEYYNHQMSGGKWNGILTPEKFPPPVNAMHPVCRPPVEIPDKSDMIVSLWNEGEELVFVKPDEKWFDIAPSGRVPIDYEICAPEWIKISSCKGIAQMEDRIFVSADCKRGDGIIQIKNLANSEIYEIHVKADFADTDCENISDGGIVSVAASSGKGSGWKEIKNLGRGGGSVMEARENGDRLEYEIYLTEPSDDAELEIHRFPSLNSTGRIRAGISIDGGKVIVAETESTDEWRGEWKNNILNNADKLLIRLPHMDKGSHTIVFSAIDKYFAFSRFAVYTAGRRVNNTASSEGNAVIPDCTECEMYKDIQLLPRPSVYASEEHTPDTLKVTCTAVQDAKYAETVKIKDVIDAGKSRFVQENGVVKIDAAAALLKTEYADYSGSWTYCNSESHGRSSVAVYADGEMQTVDVQTAPYLRYEIETCSGNHTIWLLTKITRHGDDFVSVSIDNKFTDSIQRRGKLWRYEAEQIWRWVPIAEVDLTSGVHTVKIYSRTIGIRFDRIYITAGKELPPTDLTW